MAKVVLKEAELTGSKRQLRNVVCDKAADGDMEAGGKRNGNYKHGARSKEVIALRKFIRSLS